MSFIPDEVQNSRLGSNLAPMIDFLFLMLVFFATLAVSRVATRETEIDLVQVREVPGSGWVPGKEEDTLITINVTKEDGYDWVTEVRSHPMESAEAIGAELRHQYQKGLLPRDRERTRVMLKVDRQAHWEPVLKVLFAIREAGFTVHPVYEPEEVGASI